MSNLYPDDEKIYMGSMHPDDKKVIDRLTVSRHWDYGQFRQVLIALATVGAYLPAYNRPESIHLGKLGPIINELRDRAKGNGKEHARTLSVDTKEAKLIVCKNITVGSENRVRLDWTVPRGRERYCKKALDIHVHPYRQEGSILGGLHLSDADFESFLVNSESICMIMAWAGMRMIALKTSGTPNNMSQGAIERQIETIKQDYLNGSLTVEKLIAFTRQVCCEFGLVLYIATPQSRDLADRVNVAS